MACAGGLNEKQGSHIKKAAKLLLRPFQFSVRRLQALALRRRNLRLAHAEAFFLLFRGFVDAVFA